jgi:hypothetical protein
MSNPCTVTGTLSDEQTVILDEPVPLPAGRVRVTVEALSTSKSDGTFLSKLEAIRRDLRASGYRFRTKEEIDAQIQAERESWES